MIMSTMGSQYWPVTPEGRLLCVLLALYVFAIFGYITATIASLFIGRDKNEDAEKEELQAIRQELTALRKQLENMCKDTTRSI